jgi:ribosomal protein S18 acetylase RimI-like enzyme
MAVVRQTPSGASVEILDLRHFSSSDLRPVLEQETDLWSELLFWDYSSSAEMILRYVDAKILPGYAALERGSVFGYSFFVYEGSKGVIGDLFVGNGRRGASDQETEMRLITHVVETLQQSPGIHRVESQLLVHETGSVARPFLEQGFSRYPRLFMVLPLQPARAEDSRPALPPDIELQRWTEQDYQAAAAVITAAYRHHIDSDINDQYRSIAGSLRFLNNIVRFPGCGTFDPEASFLAVHKRSRTAVGLILCSRVKAGVGHVTQICVLPDQRGRRIGEALLEASAGQLRRQNFSLLSLTVTQANARAVELYNRLGFSTRRVFDAFVWEG